MIRPNLISWNCGLQFQTLTIQKDWGLWLGFGRLSALYALNWMIEENSLIRQGFNDSHKTQIKKEKKSIWEQLWILSARSRGLMAAYCHMNAETICKRYPNQIYYIRWCELTVHNMVTWLLIKDWKCDSLHVCEMCGT